MFENPETLDSLNSSFDMYPLFGNSPGFNLIFLRELLLVTKERRYVEGNTYGKFSSISKALLTITSSPGSNNFMMPQSFSVNLSPGFKNEFYTLQRGFQSFVNSAWISRGFRVDPNKC